jgi:hypothetical protein
MTIADLYFVIFVRSSARYSLFPSRISIYLVDSMLSDVPFVLQRNDKQLPCTVLCSSDGRPAAGLYLVVSMLIGVPFVPQKDD